MSVANHMCAIDVAAAGELVDIVEVACDPMTRRSAVTVAIARTSRSDAVHRVGVLDDDGSFRHLDLPYDSTRGPAWTRDGQALAVIGTRADGLNEVAQCDASGTATHTWAVDGLVEHLEWSPDGTRLAVLVASPGAEISDVYGSGTVGGSVAGWEPRVSPSMAGRRTLLITARNSPLASLAPVDSELSAVSDINVWEFAWAGPDRFVAVVSNEPDEGSWYAARVVEMTIDGSVRTLHQPAHQVACPRADFGSSRWSVIEGAASDRGLLAGTLLVGDDSGAARLLDIADVHVTDHQWGADSTITLVGVRGLGTAVGSISPTDGTGDVTWTGPQAAGRYVPAIALDATGRPMLVLEDYAVPPHLIVLEMDGPRTLLTSETAGSMAAVAQSGSVETVTWTGAEGWSIEGLLAIPDGEGRHPLVVNVHGGPISAWRNSWCGRDPHTNSLVAAGYAVLKPNPRGSFGRGAKFAEAVIGDMGGLDAHDILSGIEALRTRRDIDVSRTGVTGNSYGGYMATWLPTLSDVIRASVARSPVTDWLTQHFTSNIAAFDERFLDGGPFDFESQFRTRSPLHRLDALTIPVMLTAGALDLATPASQAQILHAALHQAGVPTSLVIFPEEGHGVRRQEALVDQCTRMVGWFDRHLACGGETSALGRC